MNGMKISAWSCVRDYSLVLTDNDDENAALGSLSIMTKASTNIVGFNGREGRVRASARCIGR
jgi:hypothetical protein